MYSLQDYDIDIAFLTETWLTDRTNSTTATIKSFGYEIIHEHRHDSRGGGTAIIFKSLLKVRPINLGVSDIITTFGFISCCAKFTSDMDVLLLCIYRTGPVIKKFFDDLNELLSLACLKSDYVILAGDFNIHAEYVNAHMSELMETTTSYGLKILFDDIPTHIDGGCIDLVFYSSNILDKTNYAVDSKFDRSDHFPITATTLQLNITHKQVEEITFRDLNNPLILSALNREVSKFVKGGCPVLRNFEATVHNMFSTMSIIMNQNAPLITKKITAVRNAPWFDSEYKRQRALRRKSERKWRASGNLEDEIRFREAETDADNMVLSKKKAYYSKRIECANGDPRTLFNIVSREFDRKSKSPLPAYEDKKKLASDFNDFFFKKVMNISKNFEISNHDQSNCLSFYPCNLGDKESDDHLNEFAPCSIEELEMIIKETGINCAPDDFLPSEILKENISLFLPVLCKLVNMSLKEGSIDGLLKTADIIPTIKDLGLDPNDLKNYRPISNLSFLGKLIERVVLRRLNEHMARHELDVPEQSAYKKFNSTETISVKVMNDLLVGFDSNSATVLIMLDLSSAFDTVSHKKLLYILYHEMKIGGTALRWFKSFLTDRRQRIRLESVLSETIVLMFGVPQGSVLGPVLFNIYIRSLYATVKATGFCIQGYADDQQIYKCFKTCDQALTLNIKLVNCFQTVQEWMFGYHLQLNPGKTKIIIFAPSKILKEISIHGVQLTNAICTRFISTTKSLGIHLDEHLQLKDQVMKVKRDSFRVLRDICKRRHLFSKDQLKTIINSLVICKLDYCNAIYYGVSEKLLDELQRIQNAAAKTIVGLYKHDHLGSTLKELHWLPIRSRIEYKILLLVFKCLNSMGPAYLTDMLSYASFNHKLYLKEPKLNTLCGERAFCKSGPYLWNRLTDAIKCCTTLESFKVTLKTYLFNNCYGQDM